MVEMDEEGREGRLQAAVGGVGDGIDEDDRGGVRVEEQSEALQGVGDVGGLVVPWSGPVGLGLALLQQDSDGSSVPASLGKAAVS